MKEVSSVALQQALKELDSGYLNFFKALKNKVLHIKQPKYRSKNDNQSFYLFSNAYKFDDNNNLHLSKIGNIKIKMSRSLPSIPKSLTVLKNKNNEYYVSYVVSIDNSLLPKTHNYLGIDLGENRYITDSKGNKIYAPKFLKKFEKKIKLWDRRVSKRKLKVLDKDGNVKQIIDANKRVKLSKGDKLVQSSNRIKARKEKNKVHNMLQNYKDNWLQKLTTKYSRDNQGVFLEDLKVKEMIEKQKLDSKKGNRNLNRGILSSCWSTFIKLMEYKFFRYRGLKSEDIKVNPRYTSQMCNICKYINSKVKDLRKYKDYWTCDMCNSRHHRDVNAAINIRTAGLEALGLNAGLVCGLRDEAETSENGQLIITPDVV